MRPLIWVSKSMDKLAEALTAGGHPISADTVDKELVKLGFSRQFNRKTNEGSRHPDRNAQFEHINTKVGGTGGRATGHFGRYEEEGTDRQLQEWRLRLPAQGRSPARKCARFRR